MVGQTISHYKILEKLGEGGMGVVYRAEDIKLKRIVALKFLPQYLTKTEEEQARFLQEAQAAATLNHPNVCAIHTIEEHDGPEGTSQQLIDMEYVDGETLRQKLAGGGFKVSESISYALQMGEALQEAHSKGIVHRDIKPDNIMVNSKNQIKVMDFGLAKLKGSLRLTRTSSTVGTLAYMAPEQIQGGEVDARSDIFSFGVVLFEMLTGRSPFRGDHEAAMMYSILNEEPDPLTKYLPEASPELTHILGRALEKDPEDRYQTVHDMVIDLRRLKKDTTRIVRTQVPSSTPASSVAVPTPSTQSQPIEMPAVIQSAPKRWILVAAGLVVLIAAVIVGYVLLAEGPETGERLPIAVADIVNETKEPELDGLSGMLITSLEQSRRLAVMTRSRMFDILRQMGRGGVERIDETVGREICRQANVSAMVVASIRKFDRLYSIDLKILDPTKNEYIFTAKEEGEGKSAIPGMIDRLSEKTRMGLKERTSEVQANKEKVSDLTTTNLEAYQHYFLGEQFVNKLAWSKAEEEFRKALEIDSTFAQAYYRLAYVLAWNSHPGADKAIAKAMQYIDKVPEKERYLIRGEDAMVRKDLLRGLAIYKEFLNVYPDEKEAVYLVGDYSFHLGDYPVAAAYLERVVAMDPTFERAYQHLCWTYALTQRSTEFLETARKYVARVPDEQSYELFVQAYVAQVQFDSARIVADRGLELLPGNAQIIEARAHSFLVEYRLGDAEREFSMLTHSSRPLSEQRLGYRGLSAIALLEGKSRRMVDLLDKELETAVKEGNRSMVGQLHATKAIYVKRLLSDSVRATAEVRLALQERDAESFFYFVGLFYAHIALGEIERARELARENLSVVIGKINYYIDGYASLQAGNYGAAVASLKALEPAIGANELYALAQCYIKLSQPDNAVEILRRVQTSNVNPVGGYHGWAEFYPKSYYLLGKALEMKGDRARAIKSYERVLAIWENADKDLPELIDAKVSLAKLKAVATK